MSLFATIWNVGTTYKLKKVHAALELAQSGDTIIVQSGLYTEGTLTINKKLVLIGINYPVLDGEKKAEVVSIKHDSVVFNGFRVQRSGYATLDDPGGIKVYNSNNVAIINNDLYDNFFGIYIQYGKHCRIQNNKIKSLGKDEQAIGNGIHCWKSDSLLIIGNKIQGHRDGIYFEFVTHSLIWRNQSEKNIRYGLHFMFSNNDTYVTNTFNNNGAGVAVMFSHKVNMFNNTFSNNWGDAAYGILLKEISDCVMQGNRFTSNTIAVYMEGTNRIKIYKCVFQNNGWGLKIQASCMDNSIELNNFLSNTFDVSTNGSLVLNTFSNNYWDKYNGYDLNKDKIGDIPFHPLSLFAVLVEQNNPVMLLYQSLFTVLLDKSEKLIPSLTPDNFIDESPRMLKIVL
ncbi:MAG: nitrous oxide reductase family maturation protein NosD [Bacteroidia bacterium]|nr:nitrous oxide reductase family maturation protein NosD [Bacteroidia bacterium]